MRVGERPGADLDEIVLLERLRDTERQLGYISQHQPRRLGKDRRQEGRADYARQAAHGPDEASAAERRNGGPDRPVPINPGRRSPRTAAGTTTVEAVQCVRTPSS